MLGLYIFRSIPLSRETFEAWKSVGATFYAKTRTASEALDMFSASRAKKLCAFINLGSSDSAFSLKKDPALVNNIYNPKDVVDILLTPAAMRRSVLAALIPPFPKEGEPYWVKGYGRHGLNKARHDSYKKGDERRHRKGCDLQKHVEGVEYRVVTVGPVVVQVSQRVDTDPDEGRVYRWVGVKNAPPPVKSIARYAAAHLPHIRTIIGWDIIFNPDTRKVYILEGNTSPGVNFETAGRIADVIGKFEYGYSKEQLIEMYENVWDKGDRNPRFNAIENDDVHVMRELITELVAEANQRVPTVGAGFPERIEVPQAAAEPRIQLTPDVVTYTVDDVGINTNIVQNFRLQNT